MNGLDQKAAERLAKLCGMFGSDNDGERANAARMADNLVRGRGLSWFDVIRPQRPATPPPPPQPQPEPVRERFNQDFNAAFSDTLKTDDLFWSYKLDFCKAHIIRLSQREADFINSLTGSSGVTGRPSEKQMKWLNDVYNRIVFG